MKLHQVGLVAIGLALSAHVQGQTGASAAPPTTERTPQPAARSSDVESTRAITAALYQTISGPAGSRDWDRFRSLFSPNGRLINNGVRADGTHTMRSFSPDEYIAAISPQLAAQPFYEEEISRREEQFGVISQAFSTYASKRAPTDSVAFSRGINSIQMVNDGKRWFIVSITWDAERPGQSIPATYLIKP